MREELDWTRGARVPYERDASIADVFGAVAAQTPDAVALVDARDSVSYAELERRSNRFARYLQSLGVVSGSRVGVAFERSIELPVVLLGILKAGAAYVPLDATYPCERLAFTIADAGVGFVVVVQPPGHEVFAGSCVVNVRDDAAAIALCDATRPDVRIAADALAYIMYTSGSTGWPKGVEIVQRGVLRLVRGADYVSTACDEVFLHFAPLAFDASTFEIWAPLLNGARLAIPSAGALSLSDLGESLERFGVTVLWLTASLFGVMVRTELRRCGGLRYLLTGGDVVSPADAIAFVNAYPACRLINGYGPTENTTFSCCYEIVSPERIGANVPIGRPIANATAYVLDERLQPVPPGTPGELCVGGDGIARAYTNLPRLTADRFLPDPFSPEPGARIYRTGDRVRLRSDGLLEFLGRSDHQVKIRGYRIELGEIEIALRAHSGVVEAVVSVVCDRTGKSLAAHVVAVPGTGLDSHTVRAYLGTKLPQHMIPNHIAFVDELCKHPSGKLDRSELARRASARTAPARVSFHGTRTNVERTIGACWRDVLGDGADSDLDVNFFDAGGDSLRLLALHERIVRALGFEIDLLDLFAYASIRALGAALADRVCATSA